ncbi:leucine-rich repeat-containing protein 24 [Galleria mellonella]|uniref:Leucine-rich repeat-containing protein 24 n=1 Tax=Galleria mellonella TaxID=7137 RepID=A0A6J1WEW5_GALME|nr:leucine-rich repeat-containing protein 24 [Galleria mellonella]
MWVLLILALAAAATADCPHHCECKWRSGKESALCAHAGLTAVPPRLDPTTQLLDLAQNSLPILRNDAFAAAGLLNLQRLYLPSCNVRTIRNFAFRALVNLVELDLSRNLLDNIPSHAFDSIPELRELRLSGNPITKISDEAFLALPHLVRLTLSACKISEIGPRGFIGLEASLEYLELSKNKLQVLHVAVLAPLRSLKGLELANNPWDCTCALRPMRDWMIRRNVPATVVPDCALPPRLMSQSWDRLDLEDFACRPEVSAARTHFKGVEGEEVTLVCRVSGVPAPRVRWIRAGRLLANTTATNVNSGRTFMLRSEGKTSNLTIKSTDIQDTGSYTCNAENRAGKAEVTLSLVIEKKPQNRSFGGRALMAGMAVSAVIVLSSCLIVLCAYETRKKRQLDRWNEQIVTTNHRDDSYEKIEANIKNSVEVPRVIPNEGGRKRGDYRNVPSHDPEDDYQSYLRNEVQEEVDTSITPPTETAWHQPEYSSRNTRNSVPERDLHIPRFSDYNLRADETLESVQSSNSTGVLSAHVEILSENNRFNNNLRSCPRPRTRDRLDNDLSGSDSEKNYPDLIEMSALGTSSYLRNELKHDPYYFYTIPRRKDGDSRSPLLSSRRNSSGGDSATFFDRPYEKNRQRHSGRRSNSFLDLSTGGNRIHRNPSLPASPSREQPTVPSATPLLDLSGLRDYSRTGQPLEDFDFRASQLEKFLEEYRSLREQLSRMKETRENLQRNRAVDNEELRSILKGKPSVAVTETSSSVALADAASPLALSPPEYKPQQSRPEWLTTLLYRN